MSQIAELFNGKAMQVKACYFIIVILSLIGLLSCNSNPGEMDYVGFWQGPHPEDIHKKFYIEIEAENDSIIAKGFWTDHKFYSSKFEVDSLFLDTDSIRFFVPDWHCTYIGRILGRNVVRGGFRCQGEPFDTVNLVRHTDAKRFLTEAKPNCNCANYEYHYAEPLFIDESIQVAGYESANDSLFIYSLVSEIITKQYGRINSFLLLKDGKVICEEYFYGYSRSDLHQIESSTKSIASLLIGLAIKKGMITDVNEPLYKIFNSFPHLKAGNYRKITLADVLRMTSGYSGEYEPYREDDRVAFALKRELVAPPGEQFIYDGGNTEILGAILKIKTGIYADAFAEAFLFKPLGIQKYDWSKFKQDSFPCMGGSLHMQPVDMLKIGMLVLNKGMYNNIQIIESSWINEATSAKTSTNIDGDSYGYQWWNISIESNNREYNTIWANGIGSQFIFIVPDLNVVIVTTGSNYEYDSWAITNGIGKYLYLLDN